LIRKNYLKDRESTAFLTTDPLVHFSSRRNAEGKCKFSQVNDLVACFWVIFGSRPEILELTQSLNSYFLKVIYGVADFTKMFL